MIAILIATWFVLGFVGCLAIRTVDAYKITVADVIIAVGLSPFCAPAALLVPFALLLEWADDKVIWRRK